jgi:hypothetical protein
MRDAVEEESDCRSSEVLNPKCELRQSMIYDCSRFDSEPNTLAARNNAIWHFTILLFSRSISAIFVFGAATRISFVFLKHNWFYDPALSELSQ